MLQNLHYDKDGPCFDKTYHVLTLIFSLCCICVLLFPEGDSKAHFLQPDSYQVTWWPGDRPQDDVQSDSTTGSMDLYFF